MQSARRLGAMSDGSTLNEHVSEAIRIVLVKRRMSAAELARQAGMSQPYISRRLTGAAIFDLADLESIARVLEVPVTDLLPAPTAAQRSDQSVRPDYRNATNHPMPEQTTHAQIAGAHLPHTAHVLDHHRHTSRTGTRRPRVKAYTHDGVTA
jgi:transcriptional regulator with XRE-family HTH domain